MSNIQNVSREGKWRNSATTINENFLVFETELNSIDGDLQKCKGLFPSLNRLKEDYPSPATGSWAYVGTRLPADIYIYYPNTGWVNTGKTGGDSLDPQPIYANSVPLEGSAEIFYNTEIKWIQSTDNGESWQNLHNRIIKINMNATTYIIRPTRLIFGEEGDLLGASTTDPYLAIFRKGSFVSMNLLTSSGISRDYTNNYLSWTIDRSFYTRIVSGNVTDRMPVEGDILRATLKFKSPPYNDVNTCTTVFRFSN